MLLAVSSSGEFRDLVEAIDAGAPAPVRGRDVDPGLHDRQPRRRTSAVTVSNQRAVTHTQAFCGNVVAVLGMWAKLTSDPALASALARLPEQVARASLAATRRGWTRSARLDAAGAQSLFGSGPAWAAALEAALLLKEVSGIPAEGVETREGATSTMMALRPGDLALSLPTAADQLLEEAEEVCAGRGARVLRAPAPAARDRRLAAVTPSPPPRRSAPRSASRGASTSTSRPGPTPTTGSREADA